MWPNPQETVELVTFNIVIFNAKLQFLCSVDKARFVLVIIQSRKISYFEPEEGDFKDFKKQRVVMCKVMIFWKVLR